MSTMALAQKLNEFYDENVERVGFVLPNDEIVEVENISPTPEKGFNVSSEDVMKYGDTAIATWHTHPKSNFNLSSTDMHNFLNWPSLSHYIVGSNGVREYRVVDGEVLIA